MIHYVLIPRLLIWRRSIVANFKHLWIDLFFLHIVLYRTCCRLIPIHVIDVIKRKRNRLHEQDNSANGGTLDNYVRCWRKGNKYREKEKEKTESFEQMISISEDIGKRRKKERKGKVIFVKGICSMCQYNLDQISMKSDHK